VNKISSIAMGVLFFSLAMAQKPSTTTTPPLQRQVRGQTIVSTELADVDLTFDKDFRYVGGQVVNLYGNAEAEQHLFVKPGRHASIKRFYWVQFEHFLPSNTYTYNYPADRTVDLGALRFVYDVKSFSDYAVMQTDDPASDGAAISKLLAQHNLAFPKKAARVRMFHLPTTDRRTEVMIIYGESLPRSSKVPATIDGVGLGRRFP
jgi:hypothetical protein